MGGQHSPGGSAVTLVARAWLGDPRHHDRGPHGRPRRPAPSGAEPGRDRTADRDRRRCRARGHGRCPAHRELARTLPRREPGRRRGARHQERHARAGGRAAPPSRDREPGLLRQVMLAPPGADQGNGYFPAATAVDATFGRDVDRPQGDRGSARPRDPRARDRDQRGVRVDVRSRGRRRPRARFVLSRADRARRGGRRARPARGSPGPVPDRRDRPSTPRPRRPGRHRRLPRPDAGVRPALPG